MYRLIVLSLLLLPAAEAATMHFNPGQTIEDIHAEGEDLVLIASGDLTIRGTIQTHVAGPGQSGPNITLHVNGALTFLPGSTVIAASGAQGDSSVGIGRVQAPSGGDGGSILIHAQTVLGNGVLVPGHGGHGGNAMARGHPGATAVGGHGGDAGTIQIEAHVLGSIAQQPAHAGTGGHAEARGEDGENCTSQGGEGDSQRGPGAETTGPGGDANATGTHGACGPWNGTGGRGGYAEAYGGNGGTAMDGNGGDGGDAFAYGGTGGDGRHACFETTDEAQALYDTGVRRAGDGGAGGTATAIGGDGGMGIEGGAGGDAYARTEGGQGGNATQPIGLGSGGWNTDPNSTGGGAVGGSGGDGVTDGGSGGKSLAEGFGGDGGSGCGPLIYQGWDIPSPGLVVPLATLALAAVLRRR